jgi:chromate transporter
MSGEKRTESCSLREIAFLFLKLGFTAFGGPAAHIAMMKTEVVARRRWMTETQFLDLLGAVNLIPGPNSTELAIHIGFMRGGWAGLLLAGICFILPAALVVFGCAWAYVRFGSLPETAAVLYGIKPVIIAIVLEAIWGLGKAALKSRFLAVIGATSLTLALLGINELLLLFGAGALAGIRKWSWRGVGKKRHLVHLLLILLFVTATVVLVSTTVTHHDGVHPGSQARAFSTSSLFLFFVKVGAVLYGSGYVLLAFVRDGLVNQRHWLTDTQLLDAIAIGQVTPGPVFTTATFIGYLLGGPLGASAATLGIFLPSFVFVALSGPLLPHVRNSPLAGAFLDGLNVAALALILEVVVKLARSALVDAITVGFAVTGLLLLVRFRLNTALLIFGAAVAGILMHR